MVLSLLRISRLAGIHALLLQQSQSLVIPSGQTRGLLQAPILSSKLSSVTTGDDLDLTEPDRYLITDSLELSDSERPTVLDFICSSPREGFLRLPLILSGTALSICNVIGYYGEQIYTNIVISCVGLGFCNAIADLVRGDISKNIRRGSIDEKVLRVYSGTYTASTSWLALRVYPQLCPEWLPAFDPVIGWVSVLVFAGSVISPLLSVWSNADLDNEIIKATQVNLMRIVRRDFTIKGLPPFTSTEEYRARSLIAIGFVASLYLPPAVYFGLYGESWWSTSLENYPQQGLLESSTALFGIAAAQANFAITSAARYGVKPLTQMVNVGTAVTFGLAVLPVGCALYFLQDGTTFFDHYNYHP